MAITTSFTLSSTADLPTGQFEGQAALTSLGSGGFLAAGFDSFTFLGFTTEDINFADFDANGAVVGGITDGPNGSDDVMNPSLDQMWEGNVAVAYEDGDQSFVVIVDETGAQVVAPFQIGVGTGVDRTAPDLAAIRPTNFFFPSTAGFVVANETEFAGSDTDIVLRTFAQDGTLRETLSVDNSSALDFAPSVTQLDNGNIAVAWHRTDGTGTDLYYAVYDRTLTTTVQGATLLDGSGQNNRDAQIVATDNGFAVFYEETEIALGGGSSRIKMQSLDGDGNILGSRILASAGGFLGAGSVRDVKATRLDDGLIGVIYESSQIFFGGSDVDVNAIVIEDDHDSIISATALGITGGNAAGNDAETGDLALFDGGIAVMVNDTTTGGTAGEVLQFGLQVTSDAASDTMVATARAENFVGGDGTDTVDYSGSTAGVTANLGSTGAGGFAQGDTFAGVENLIGSADADSLVGNAQANTLTGGDGDDTITGAAGRDTLSGELGDDVMLGGGGADSLGGGDGNDNLTGGGRRDRLEGNAGDDLLNGALGGDSLNGGAGNDDLIGGAGRDRLFGEDGVDTLAGNGGADLLDGGTDADVLNGGAGNDRLFGGLGADTLNGGAGRDTLDGGGGADTFVFGPGSGRDVISVFNGGDRIQLGGGLSFGDVNETAIGGGVRLTFDGQPGLQLTILGVTTAQIDAGDFIA